MELYKSAYIPAEKSKSPVTFQGLIGGGTSSIQDIPWLLKVLWTVSVIVLAT